MVAKENEDRFRLQLAKGLLTDIINSEYEDMIFDVLDNITKRLSEMEMRR